MEEERQRRLSQEQPQQSESKENMHQQQKQKQERLNLIVDPEKKQQQKQKEQKEHNNQQTTKNHQQKQDKSQQQQQQEPASVTPINKMKESKSKEVGKKNASKRNNSTHDEKNNDNNGTKIPIIETKQIKKAGKSPSAASPKPGNDSVVRDSNRPKEPTPVGTPKGGTLKGGTPKGGTPKGGTPKGGTPKAGTPKAGTPKAGTPKAGTPKKDSAEKIDKRGPPTASSQHGKRKGENKPNNPVDNDVPHVQGANKKQKTTPTTQNETSRSKIDQRNSKEGQDTPTKTNFPPASSSGQPKAVETNLVSDKISDPEQQRMEGEPPPPNFSKQDTHGKAKSSKKRPRTHPESNGNQKSNQESMARAGAVPQQGKLGQASSSSVSTTIPVDLASSSDAFKSTLPDSQQIRILSKTINASSASAAELSPSTQQYSSFDQKNKVEQQQDKQQEQESRPQSTTTTSDFFAVDGSQKKKTPHSTTSAAAGNNNKKDSAVVVLAEDEPYFSNEQEKELAFLQKLDGKIMAAEKREPSEEMDDDVNGTMLPKLSSDLNKRAKIPRHLPYGKSMDPDFRYGLKIPKQVVDLCCGCRGARDEEAEKLDEPTLLCDREGCLNEFHLGCCLPPLSDVPEGAYYCIDCDPKGATSSLEEYFEDHEEKRGEHGSSWEYHEWLLKTDLEDNDTMTTPGSTSISTKVKAEDQIPQSELWRCIEMQNIIGKKSPAERTSPNSTIGPEFFLGKPIRMHCPYDNTYHTGRIVDYRRTLEEGKPLSKLASFVSIPSTSNYEFLVRFPSGKEYRKQPLHHWIRLEEHSLAVGTHLIWGKYKRFQPAMILMRTARELMPVKHMLREEEGEVVYQWSSQRERPTRLWALAKRFGEEEDGFKLLSVSDEAIDLFGSEQPPHRSKNKTLYALAVAEWYEQERVKKWRSLPLSNPLGSRGLRSLDEYALPPLGQTTREDALCPLIPQGIDRDYLTDRLAQRGIVEPSKDVAANMDCQIHLRLL